MNNNNYKKFYKNNSELGVYYSPQAANILKITRAKLQIISKLAGIKKDSAGLYIYRDEDIQKLKNILEAMKR